MMLRMAFVSVLRSHLPGGLTGFSRVPRDKTQVTLGQATLYLLYSYSDPYFMFLE